MILKIGAIFILFLINLFLDGRNPSETLKKCRGFFVDLETPKGHFEINWPFKGLVVKNSKDMKKEYENFLPFAEKCQDLSSILAPKFREYKVFNFCNSIQIKYVWFFKICLATRIVQP